jgi:hypothetical protein
MALRLSWRRFRGVTMSNLITKLTAALPNLPERDRPFATSLLRRMTSLRPLTPKQLYWAETLAARGAAAAAAAAAPAAPTTAEQATIAAGRDRVYRLLDGARQRGLLRPALRFPATLAGITVSLPSSRSRYNGEAVVFVKARGDYAGMLIGTEFRPSRDWHPSQATRQEFDRALAAVMADPTAEAVAAGHATGACCFCRRALTDARSVHHGYGPICAEHYGLPWDADRATARVENREAALPLAEAA